ncbi:MAG: hypothetical protein CVT95_06275 [Bacteroidetes bacterium HGW-Bacteroidetes-12]|nr:MAG: hypothetical protein CVT95_06275 [Bacteroidetes bacterium HGW-Bacteroidetes-12]
MEKTVIKQALNVFSKKKGMSKNELANKLGVSSATLSNIENERWEKIKDEMLLKIWNAIKGSDWQLVETSNFQTIFKTCEHAKEQHRMVGVIGATGTGKTTALNEYYICNENTFYIVCQKSTTSRVFFKQLLREMGVLFAGTLYEMIERVADELNKREQPLLLIDEAGKLSQTVLEHIHDLRNKTEHTTGILMVGVEYFKTNLETAAKKNKEGMPEFYDRIASWVELSTPRKDEIRSICEVNGITNPELVARMQKSQTFRTLSNYIGNVKFHEKPIERFLQPQSSFNNSKAIENKETAVEAFN